MDRRDLFRIAWEKAANDLPLRKRTQQIYWHWTRRFFLFCGRRSSETWCGADWERFERHLQAEGHSVSGRVQARCTCNFLFRHVLQRDVGPLDLPKLKRPRGTTRTIPARPELSALFAQLHGRDWLMAMLMYGSLLRVGECCTLRVKDLDFANGKIDLFAAAVGGPKGGKNRQAWLPQALVEPLQKWVRWRGALHEWDLSQGHGRAPMPGRLGQKYPARQFELGWQYLFPSKVVDADGIRWHATEKIPQQAIQAARLAAGILKDVTPHTLRHAGATHGLRTPGNDIEIIRERLGHVHLDTTAIYLHADEAAGLSPLDAPLLQPAVYMPMSPRTALLMPPAEPALALP